MLRIDMKIYMCVIILSIFSSCSMPFYGGIDHMEFNTIEEISEYVGSNISRKADKYDFWQYPNETLDRGAGDCEDYASLKAYLILNNRLSEDVLLVAAYSNKYNICHMLIQVDGVYMESVRDKIYYNKDVFDVKYKVLYKLSYDDYIAISKIMHIFKG